MIDFSIDVKQIKLIKARRSVISIDTHSRLRMEQSRTENSLYVYL